MPRLGYMIVDGLAFVMAGIGLTAVVAGYRSNLPDPAPQAVEAAHVDPDWRDPVTTGSITPKSKGAAASTAGSRAEPGVDETVQSPTAGSGAWVDPPRRWNAGGQAEPATDPATGLRVPRL